MADFSKITSPTGAEFVVKDTTARADISTLTSTVAGKITNPSGGTAGQVLTKTANGETWATPSGGGSVDTVNNIQPDAQKNVQTVVELTQAEYTALAVKDPNVVYYIKDAPFIPSGSLISADGVTYDNTESGLDANRVQAAIDENASDIADLKSGLTSLDLSKLTGGLVSAYNRCQIGGNISNIFYIRAYLDAGTSNYIQLLCNGIAKTMSLSLCTNGTEVQIFSVTGS